jgi:hypothetical protein
MTLLLLFACGSVSNGIFAEDGEFLSALPSSERQSIPYEGDLADDNARAAIGERADLVVLSVNTAAGVNAFIFTIVGVVDHVRELPPAERTDDERRWGPFEVDCGLTVGVRMARAAEVYDWSFSGHVAGGVDTTFLYGTHYAGASVEEGDGSFVYDHGQHSAWCGSGETGTLTVDYDNREGIDLVVGVDGYSTPAIEEQSFTYALRRTTDAGDFQYRYIGDIEDDGSEADASVEVRNRWVPGTGGRSDAFVTGGGFAEREWRWSQCWDAGGRLTWEGESLGLFEESGDPGSCVYDDVAEVDRI